MRIKVFALVLVMAMLTSALPVGALAAENDVRTDVIYYDDGSYLEVTTGETLARTTYGKTGYKKLTYRDGSDNVEWVATLTATFTYNGTTATCTNASCTVDISENAWYVVSEATSRSGSTATTNLTMGEKLLLITIAKYDYTITLTCDKDGNLS